MDVEALNRSLFLALNAPAGLGGASLALAAGAAKGCVFFLAALLAWRWIAGGSTERRALVTVALAVVPALAINYALGLAYPHPRPFMIGLGQAYLAHRAEASFPSDHATLMWTVALALLLWLPTKRPAWAALALAALTSWARVFLGVHFPLDILGSIAVAALTILALTPLRSGVDRLIGSRIDARWQRFWGLTGMR